MLLGFSYYLIGQVDTSIHYLQYRMYYDTASPGPHFMLGVVFLEAGKYTSAIKGLKTAVSMDSITMYYHMYLGIAHAKAGMLEETRKRLEVINLLEEELRSVSFGRAALLAELGNADSAVYWLEKSYEERSQHLFYLLPRRFIFSSIRSDPR